MRPGQRMPGSSRDATSWSGGRGRAVRAAAAVLVGTLVACVDSTQPSPVADLRLEPDSVHLEPGESATFSALPLGPNGEELPDRAGRVEWEIEDGSVASMVQQDGTVTVTAEDLGVSGLRATLARGNGRGLVVVQPPGLDRIEIDPSSVVVVDGASVTFRAVLLDAEGNEMDPNGFRISWAVGDDDVAYALQSELGPTFQTFARNPGLTSIRLVVGPLTASARFEVVPAAAGGGG